MQRYTEIELREKQRDEWIAQLKQKEHEEERKKLEQAIQEKVAILKNQGDFSEDSDSDQEQEERAIQEKVDGLLQYQVNCAFHDTKLS